MRNFSGIWKRLRRTNNDGKFISIIVKINIVKLDYCNKVPISIIFSSISIFLNIKIYIIIIYMLQIIREWWIQFFFKAATIPGWTTTSWKNRDLFNRVVKINLCRFTNKFDIFFCFRYFHTSLHLRKIQQPGGCKAAGIRVSSTGVHPHRRFENKVRVDWPVTRMQY